MNGITRNILLLSQCLWSATVYVYTYVHIEEHEYVKYILVMMQFQLCVLIYINNQQFKLQIMIFNLHVLNMVPKLIIMLKCTITFAWYLTLYSNPRTWEEVAGVLEVQGQHQICESLIPQPSPKIM